MMGYEDSLNPRYFLMLSDMPILPFSISLWKLHFRILSPINTLMTRDGFLAIYVDK